MLDGERLTGLRGAAGGGFSSSANGALPWVDGAVYLGRDVRAVRVLSPPPRVLAAHAIAIDRHYLQRWLRLP
jgi:hypothetical protein